MKRLIIISTALFATASTFGIVYFVKIAHQPAIQNLYTHTSSVAQDVPTDTPEYYINQQGELDSTKQKMKSLSAKPKAIASQKKKVVKQKKASRYSTLDSKSFSRAAITEPIEPTLVNKDGSIEK